MSDTNQTKSEENAKQQFQFHSEHLILSLGSLFTEIHYHVSHGAFERGPVSAVRERLHKEWNLSKAHMDAPASRQDMTHAMSSGRYEPRSSSYAARHLYRINFSGTPDGKLSNKNRNAIKITIKKLHKIASELTLGRLK